MVEIALAQFQARAARAAVLLVNRPEVDGVGATVDNLDDWGCGVARRVEVVDSGTTLSEARCSGGGDERSGSDEGLHCD